ncbi:Exonuclease VII [Pseudomonas syringae pv. actinidiae]|uniref:Exonuclease VII n=1 Tax=Pseudomonas syringae pv. actinidiae TaxID=103796 RepID=A0A2V0QKX6_PSESF|nr:Exonuclease VII [Pseudomonas syringae pv. actinidiae]
MCTRTAFRQAANQPSGIGLPVWRAETGKRRHKVDAAIVSQLRGLLAQGLYGFAGHQPRSPLHRCAGVHNVAFHCISRRDAIVPSQCRRQAVAGGDGPGHRRH